MRVVVVVDADVVLGEGKALRVLPAAEHGHAVIRRLWVVGLALGVERAAQADRPPGTRKAGGGGDQRGRQVVERAPLVIRAPAAPVRDPIEELTELVRRDLHFGRLRHASVTLIENEAS